MNIIIERLAVPPTNNHRLMPSKGRLIKTPEFRAYDQKIELWILRNRFKVEEMRRDIERWIKEGYCLDIEMDFIFPLEKIITKKNEPKRIDVDSRLKVVQDTVAKIIGIDDKWIMQITAKKILHRSSDEHVSILIKPIRWSHMKQIREKSDGPQA